MHSIYIHHFTEEQIFIFPIWWKSFLQSFYILQAFKNWKTNEFVFVWT